MNALSKQLVGDALGDEFGTSSAEVLLCGLEAAHRSLERRISDLESVIVGPGQDAVAFTFARLKLSQASRARREIVRMAVDHLLPTLKAEDASEVRALQRQDVSQLRHSSNHVGLWSAAAAAANWGGYRDASRAIRAEMREAMRAEKRLLCPLLRRSAQARSARQGS